MAHRLQLSSTQLMPISGLTQHLWARLTIRPQRPSPMQMIEAHDTAPLMARTVQPEDRPHLTDPSEIELSPQKREVQKRLPRLPCKRSTLRGFRRTFRENENETNLQSRREKRAQVDTRIF